MNLCRAELDPDPARVKLGKVHSNHGWMSQGWLEEWRPGWLGNTARGGGGVGEGRLATPGQAKAGLAGLGRRHWVG